MEAGIPGSELVNQTLGDVPQDRLDTLPSGRPPRQTTGVAGILVQRKGESSISIFFFEVVAILENGGPRGLRGQVLAV